MDWELHKGSFAIKKFANRDENFLSIVFEKLTAFVLQHPKCIEGRLAVGAMTVTDGTTPNTLYPTLIQATQDRDAEFS